MSRVIGALGVVALLWGAAVGTASSRSIGGSQGTPGVPVGAKGPLSRVAQGDWVEGQLLVRFRPRVAQRARLGRAGALGLSGARVVDSIPDFGVDVVRLPERLSVMQGLRSVMQRPAVAHAEPNRLVRLQVIPNDQSFPEQWGLNNTGQSHPVTHAGFNARGAGDADIDAPQAWNRQTGRARTTVAVLDSGVDIEHPDLDESLFQNSGETADNNTDDDNNGYVDDAHGYNFAGDNDTLLESNRNIVGYDHGTHVAGIVAAEANNNEGIAGVCFGCRIMVLKFMRPIDTNGDGQKDTMVGSLAAELEALAYARKNGADVLNGSFGSATYSRFERRAFAALGRRGIPAVIAAGNQASDNDLFTRGSPDYPASYTLPNIISVAASNHRDHLGYDTECATRNPRYRCLFTNWGHDSVDVAAPGVDILSTTPSVGPAYSVFNGTSMAAPHVAGLAGLVKSQHPRWGATAIKNAIMNSADRRSTLRRLYAVPGGLGGRFTRTSGRVNANRALEASTRSSTAKTDGNVNGARKLKRRVRGKVRWPADVNDVYRKKLRRGRRYKAVLNGPRGADFDLAVYKPKTKEIWQIEPGCLGARGPCQLVRLAARPERADESTIFRARRGGVYYFQVSAWYLNRGRYRLVIKRI